MRDPSLVSVEVCRGYLQRKRILTKKLLHDVRLHHMTCVENISEFGLVANKEVVEKESLQNGHVIVALGYNGGINESDVVKNTSP